MKANQEITISSKPFPVKKIISEIRLFCKKTKAWKFLKLSKCLGDPICDVDFLGAKLLPKAMVSVAQEHNSNFLKVVSIVPKTVNQLTMDQYNAIAQCFFNDFKKYLKTNNLPIKISITKPNVGLTNIIKGKKTREYFERYLSRYPKSGHSYDEQRLDRFICALVRYRGSINLDYLEKYLQQDLKWSKDQSQKCRERIEIGRDVLRVNKTFPPFLL